MTKAQIIKFAGTAASFVVASGALFIHDPNWRGLVLALAGMTLTALHVQRPGDVKVSP